MKFPKKPSNETDGLVIKLTQLPIYTKVNQDAIDKKIFKRII